MLSRWNKRWNSYVAQSVAPRGSWNYHLTQNPSSEPSFKSCRGEIESFYCPYPCWFRICRKLTKLSYLAHLTRNALSYSASGWTGCTPMLLANSSKIWMSTNVKIHSCLCPRVLDLPNTCPLLKVTLACGRFPYLSEAHPALLRSRLHS